MGILGVAGFMALFWAGHKLFGKFMAWRRKPKAAEGRDNCPVLPIPGTIDPQTPRGVNSRGQHIFAGVVAGVLTYMVLMLIGNQLTGGPVVRSVLQLVALVVGVWAGVRVYRLLRRTMD